MTKIVGFCAAALMTTGLGLYAAEHPVGAAQAPRALPSPRLPKTPLHTEFIVEVNKLGQVVRVKSGKSCNNLSFNAMTYGNVLQMFIRTADGMHAIVGRYRVTYDYDPRTAKARRGVSLVSRGGTWGDKQGAANNMRDIAIRQARKHSKPLPDFKDIIKPNTVSKP